MSQAAAPISGSTAECLEHFSKHNTTSVVIGELTKFIVVKPPTVMEWLAAGRFPKGLELIRLRSFLVKAGYDVKEFSSMPEDNQKFCLMVGFGVLGVDEVKQCLDYKDHQGVLDIALRGRGVFKVRANDFHSLLHDNGERLEETIQSFQARIRGVLSDYASNGSAPPAPVQPQPVRHPDIIPENDQRVVTALAHNLNTASWLAEVVSGWDDGRERLSVLVSDRELELIISRIEKLLPAAAAKSVDK